MGPRQKGPRNGQQYNEQSHAKPTQHGPEFIAAGNFSLCPRRTYRDHDHGRQHTRDVDQSEECPFRRTCGWVGGKVSLHKRADQVQVETCRQLNMCQRRGPVAYGLIVLCEIQLQPVSAVSAIKGIQQAGQHRPPKERMKPQDKSIHGAHRLFPHKRRWKPVAGLG